MSVRPKIVACTIMMLAATCFAARVEAQQENAGTSTTNLRKIAIAMHMYHGENNRLPAHASYRNRKPLLSWRVHLLPYLNQKALYRQFHLDEPWDSKHNKSLVEKIPSVFRNFDSSLSLTKDGKTCFQVSLGVDHVFTGAPTGVSFKDIKDGTSQTILVVETTPGAAVVWTRPEDVTFKGDYEKSGLVKKGKNEFYAVFADGQTRLILKSMNFRAMLTRDQDD